MNAKRINKSIQIYYFSGIVYKFEIHIGFIHNLLGSKSILQILIISKIKFILFLRNEANILLQITNTIFT